MNPLELDMLSRPRRNRKSAGVRALTRETTLSASDLVLPLFFHEDPEDVAIESMPGCTRWSLEGLVKEAGEAHALGVPAVVLFPKIEESLKTGDCEECYNPEGLVPRAIRALKAAHPDLVVMTDVALDPYNADGHDGLVVDGEIINDETVAVLCKQALSQAEAGADIVAPSDMMDGRVAAIRDALDANGFQKVSICSYTAKYASAFYGPFRGALDSAPKAGDKKTYQMDPANAREALRELELDELEGADMVMVKPGGPYLDIVKSVRENTRLPVAVYQVSGEYLMIQAASAGGWLDREKVIFESLLGIKRAGADIILTYFAKEVAGKLKGLGQ
ncbi:porphobilinogen synthase [Roseibacillus persicicus]|uniref:Delta-aminolevulinic acid dehydratase n=1 Tax=Roseibacillus persicicus TaxID=454148 RepID=A0A918TV33_9BACT|nr:porphobilinogen synthase [Roseibacillus persicicus]GHC64615.1 delta-aminolevulinic acid dehydratase [Roseibacillus persicicus]